MSPLDAARRLTESDPFVENERAGTAFCFACGGYEFHNPHCPILALPRIVAALEAAAAMIEEVGEPVQSPEEFGATEIPDRLYRPLVAAMQGEEVTA